ncbi:hypothetical protein K9O30_03215 [Clostridium bowmanii]|uniref:hypothetical protein n=1 Tax=Clostridium bowmanii TaxID=132925 RepID=UPI001C0AFEB0|nr:hypothetical protein [Clostridium bowmanii]MBU3188370.1 hypothetical protein [Clostridium bowmanii]MCA1072759.1 hypothetical protein [Clostridium bowmanii]
MINTKSALIKLIPKKLLLIVPFLIILNCSGIIGQIAEAAVIKIESSSLTIPKEEVIKLIKTQGTKNPYYFQGLSYKVANIDKDDDFEIVAKIDGGVHVGYFFIFDKNSQGKYSLVAEKDWKVEKWDLEYWHDLNGGNKAYEMTTRAGGSGMDIFYGHVWYLKDSKFVEAWIGTLKERTAFQDILGLKIGGYQINSDDLRLYAWTTKYATKISTNKPLAKPTTIVSIFKFNGVKYVLQSQDTCGHSN